MKGKYKAIIALLLVLIILPVALFFSSAYWLPQVVGFWLPAGSSITLDSRPHFERRAISVTGVRYWVGQCEVAGVNHARLSHPSRWQLDIGELRVNPHCLSALPSEDNRSAEPMSLHRIQQLLPASWVNIDNLFITPWPQYQGALKLALTAERQTLHYQGELLTTDMILHQQSLDIRALKVRLGEDIPPLELAGTLTLALNPDGIPPEGELSSRLVFAPAAEPLEVNLSWQKTSGLLRVSETGRERELLTLPWSVAGRHLTISGGQWHWPYLGFPLQGGLALQVDDWQQGLENMTFSGRMNMVTEGQAGKGNVVLNIGPGKLSLLDSALPLRLTGEIKREQLIFYALLQGQLSGSLINPQFTFHPGSLLASRGQVNEALNIDEVRWPLAGVRISGQGIDGRLQAILRARQNFFGEMTLHLDGKAEQFLPYDNHGQWQWRYWGRGVFAPVRAKWDVQGEGEWRANQLIFSSLSTGFDKLEYGAMWVSQPRLRLTQPLVWDRDQQQPQLSGAFVLETGKTLFGGGSELPAAALNFTMTGRTPADFQFKGELQAQAIGPVRVAGRWGDERLRGEAWWPKQSLTVFQPLLPVDWKMEMKGGDLYAQVAFSAARGQGFEAGGHGVVKNGSAWLPDNQINGVDFILPFRYQDARWHLGTRGPVSLRIAEIRNQFIASNLTADLQGWYPWDEQKPLWLSNVSAGVLDGQVTMQQLTLPQKDAAFIRLKDLSSSELVHLIKPKQFTFSGRVDGGLPLWLNHPQWIVKDGWLTSPGALTFRLDNDLADAIADKNIAAGAAITWIRYLEITRSWARISLDNLGEMEMHATVTGVSRNNGKVSSVNLNYHHQENLFSLWRSLRFGENLQNWLAENTALPLVPCEKTGNVCKEKQ